MNTRECPKDSVSGTAELFCDVFKYVPKYIFSGIQVVAWPDAVELLTKLLTASL